MEVHHHQPATTSHSPKKWTHYFWEFLMLFLAVFCGFMAENMREHAIEKKREKIYMKKLVEDLESDTISYNKYARNNVRALQIIDSLIYLLKSPNRKSHLSRIYYLARMSTLRTDQLITNNRTFEEMRSSGQLRLINNQQVSDSISNYYQSLKLINTQNERISVRVNEYFLAMGKVFDAEIFLQIFKNATEPVNQSLQLLTEDPQQINQLLSLAQYLYGTFTHVENQSVKRFESAENLIKLIKSKYL